MAGTNWGFNFSGHRRIIMRSTFLSTAVKAEGNGEIEQVARHVPV